MIDTVVNNVSSCRVFLIEDDKDDQLFAKRELLSSGFVHEVMTFCDGCDLFDYMHEEGFMDHTIMLYSPLLLLVDLEMPGKNGLEIIAELKSDPFLNPIPLVVLTGTESPEKLKSAQELGAAGVLKKPLQKKMIEGFFSSAWQWPPPELYC